MALASLRHVPPNSLSSLPPPSRKIITEDDLAVWKVTTGYRDYVLFLRRLNESVVGHTLPYDAGHYPSIDRVLGMLNKLDSWIDETPPLETPQRFGNLAFRKWGQRLEDETDELLRVLAANTLSDTQVDALAAQLKPYLVTSFGSFTRMDYGTGHEASFALFLLCLYLIRFFNGSDSSEIPTEVDRQLALVVLPAYLSLTYKLQDTYRLEPAGSHGVWGLDDSSFLPYILGSGMLRDQEAISPTAILYPPLANSNLYFVAVERVRQVKKGPFHEHSSQLYSIATGVPKWKKVNEGLFKMYDAEVLGKRVVVQHLPLGGLIIWDPPVDEAQPSPPVSQIAGSGISGWDRHSPAYISTNTAAGVRSSMQLLPMNHVPGSASQLDATRAPWNTGSHPISTTEPLPQVTRAPWSSGRAASGK